MPTRPCPHDARPAVAAHKFGDLAERRDRGHVRARWRDPRRGSFAFEEPTGPTSADSGHGRLNAEPLRATTSGQEATIARPLADGGFERRGELLIGRVVRGSQAAQVLDLLGTATDCSPDLVALRTPIGARGEHDLALLKHRASKRSTNAPEDLRRLIRLGIRAVDWHSNEEHVAGVLDGRTDRQGFDSLSGSSSKAAVKPSVASASRRFRSAAVRCRAVC